MCGHYGLDMTHVCMRLYVGVHGCVSMCASTCELTNTECACRYRGALWRKTTNWLSRCVLDTYLPYLPALRASLARLPSPHPPFFRACLSACLAHRLAACLTCLPQNLERPLQYWHGLTCYDLAMQSESKTFILQCCWRAR